MSEIDDLRAEVENLRRQLTYQRDNNERRNRQLDALGIVWCDGGCPGGMHRYTPDREVTAQMVADLMVNARRAEAWYVSHAGKTGGDAGDRAPMWAVARAEIAALLPPVYAAVQASA
jgi:hypothetical protein